MARTKKQEHADYVTESIEEYLKRGGKITICPPGARSEDIVETRGPRSRGRKKKKD